MVDHSLRMKLKRFLTFILVSQLFLLSSCQDFFENFCSKLKGQAFHTIYETEGAFPTCTVSIFSENILGNKRTVCESLSPFEVLDTVEKEKSLDCVLGQSYECFSKDDVAINGKCFKVVKDTSCPNSYKLAHIEYSTTALWIGTFFKNYDSHLLISNSSTATVSSFPYSKKEKYWEGNMFVAGKQNFKGIRTTAFKGSSPGQIEYLKNPPQSQLCESTRRKKNTAIYYESICKMFSDISGMNSFFENGFCNFVTFKRFNYKTIQRTKGKFCEKIGANIKSILTPSNDQFALVQKFSKKNSSEQVLLLTPLLFEPNKEKNSNKTSVTLDLHVQEYKLDTKIHLERLFLDSRTSDETSAAFYWVTKAGDRKYLHLKPYVSAPIACSYGPSKYEFYNKDPLCPKDYLRFRGDDKKIRCLMITNEPQSWFGVKKQCATSKKNSHLAEFTSISEVDVARDVSRWKKKEGSLWIGLRKVSNIPFVTMWDDKLETNDVDADKPVIRVSNAGKILNDETFYFFGPDPNLGGECFKTDMLEQGQWNSQSCLAKMHGFCSFTLQSV